MARKLAISDKVVVPVKFTVNDNGAEKTHNFKLTCDRVDQDELRKVTETNGLASTFMAKVTTDWQGQQLVLEDGGDPSPFSAEAFADLMKVAGVPALCFQAYVKEVVAKEKN